MKRFVSMVTAVCLIASLAACNAQPAETGKEEDKAAYVMNVGNVAATDHPINQALRDFKEAVEERTGKNVTVDIYDNSVLGGELELLEQVVTGSLEASIEMGGGNWAGYNSAADVSLLPFLFDSVESAREAWNGAFGEKFTKEIIEPNGAYVLSYWENGMRHMTNNTRSIYKPEDMAGIKFRSSQTDMKIQMFEALGSSAVMIAFSELYTALQNKTVNGQENPLSMIYSSSFYDVQTYLTLTYHMYDPSVFIVNPQWFDSLPEEYQEIILEEADRARLLDYEYNDETVYLDLLKEEGMIVNEIDYESFAGKMGPVWEKFAETYGQDWIDAAKGQ